VNRRSTTPGNQAHEQRYSQQRFKPYPDYRDSGVQWLGMVPAHWRTDRLKWTVTMCRNGIWGEEADCVNDIACVRVADFDRTRFLVHLEEPTIRAVAPIQRIGRLLNKGDLLLEKSGGGELQPVGAVMLFAHDMEAVCSNFVARMPVAAGLDGRFLAYFHAHLYGGRVNTRSIKQTTGIQNLDADSYLNELVLWVPVPEQRAIAAFLDQETARIDELIDKKQRLIELLTEKRTALISHAVTKGLNPDAPMKDSGIDWLGPVPKHWKAVQLRRVLHSIEQGWSPSCFNYPASLEEWGVLKAGCVNSGRLDENENKLLPPEHYPDPALQIRSGDVLMSRACGTPSLVGSVGFVESCRPRLLLCDKLFRLHILERQAFAEFIALSLKSVASRGQIEGSINGAEGLANNITQATVRGLWVGVPPLSEQQQICVEVQARLSRLEKLSSRIGAAIDSLREYRSALVSAAVTGKIDVREVMM